MSTTCLNTVTSHTFPASGFYAVHRGKTTKSCIYMFWQDCREQVEGFLEAEYGIFEDIDAAVTFAMSGNRKRKASVIQGDENEKNPKVKSMKKECGTDSDRKKRTSVGNFCTDEKTLLEWEERFQEFQKLMNIYGRDVYIIQKIDKSLATWLRTCRAEMRKYSGIDKGSSISRLTKGQADKLREYIGDGDPSFVPINLPSGPTEAFRQNMEKNWEQMFEFATQYKEKHGTFEIEDENREKEEEKKIRSFFYYQSWKYHDNSLSAERIEKLQSIGIAFAKRKWRSWLQCLKEYKDLNGNTDIPLEEPLGRWIVYQKSECVKFVSGVAPGKKCRFSKERFDALTGAGIDLESLPKKEDNTDKINLEWEERFQEFKRLMEKYGRDVYVIHKIDKNLATWLRTCRAEMRKYAFSDNGDNGNEGSSTSKLTKDQADKLRTYIGDGDPSFFPITMPSGPSQEIQQKIDLNWEELFEFARQYREKHDGCIEIADDIRDTEEGKKIRSFAYYQSWKYHDNDLSADRVSKLKSIGIAFAKRKWDSWLYCIKEFKDANGHTNVPLDIPLGRWLQSQKTECVRYLNGITPGSNCRFNKERFEALKDADVDLGNLPKKEDNMESKSLEWAEMYQTLRDYQYTYGTLKVKATHNKNLGVWIQEQRRQWKRYKNNLPSSLSKVRRERLETLGFDFKVREKTFKWEERIEQLLEFKGAHGNMTNIPSTYGNGLRAFVNRMRDYYSQYVKGEESLLTEERITELNHIGFVWEANKRQVKTWEEQFASLKRYKYQFGNTLVPQVYSIDTELGWWVKSQRSYYVKFMQGKHSPITHDRIRQLEEIGFVWQIRQRDQKPLKFETGNAELEKGSFL